MWAGVLWLVRQGLRRRRTARVADESAAAAEGGRGDVAAARGAVGLGDGEGEGGAGAEEAWAAASGWRPARAADEVGHLTVRESLRYVIYA
ncbi:uncharacterized protein LOC120641216 [Panicum virgatum]|uniref:Uncharacterized protein n=1 Tax=Panicum virgatum TaxID=38727 RepID=A0A8T0QHW8_PANVG|nr:uncharacterized protein LOC120641216 [Panicum virgatum]KAG2572788.1 hypothetical protein PVAP13_7KG202150 [Panicum virgatum]